MQRSMIKVLYGILGVGLALAYLGHGILGLKGYEKFTELVTANYDKVLGGTMSADAATTIVNVIGTVDVVLAVVFLGLVVAAVRDREIAFSPFALVLFGYAIVWGLLTALSRFTATMNGAEIWDVVERGPNFMLPAALFYLAYKVRQERLPEATAERRERRLHLRRHTPTPVH